MNVTVKKRIRQIHLWLGLLSGIIVFIIAITGCLYTFQEEIQILTKEHRLVKKQAAPFLFPSKIEEIAKKQLPNKTLQSIKYNGSSKSAEALFFNFKPSYFYVVYINPYSGKVLETENKDISFFRWVLKGHYYLWLPPKIGKTIVASATLIFVVLLISGFILWYPKNKKAREQRIWFRWKKGLKWKRKNYDLHNITGFYVLIIALILAITGLVFGFSWFSQGYYSLLGGEKSIRFEAPTSKETKSEALQNPLDKTFLLMQKEYPTAVSIEVRLPKTDKASIVTKANLEAGTIWKTESRYFDQYSLEEKEVSHIYGKLKNAKTADKIMRMTYDIHTGGIFGLAGKTIAFVISLLIASLPITGFLIWFGRKYKK